MVSLRGWAGSDNGPIEVQVEVTEVDNRRAASLGVEWLDEVSFSEARPLGVVSLGSFNRADSLRGKLHWLVEEGVAEVLAQPNLITDSGTTATFHAGGEIPYVINTALGSAHVEFKPYGVQLRIEPKRIESGLIQLRVRASVSAPDVTGGVVLSGNAVPGLFEWVVTSRVSVRPGATITLAGLVQTKKDETIRGVPILRKIPLLGVFFRWKKVDVRRTTIVIFVTPREIQTAGG